MDQSDLKDQPLYRPEILAEQRSEWLGKVVVVTPPSARVFGYLAAAVILSFGALLTFGTFTSKVRVNGWLVAEQGQSRVVAPLAGVITNLKVREGAVVKAGDPLLAISAEQRSANVGATQAEIVRLLTERRQSIQAEIEQQRKLLKQQRAGLSNRIDAMQREINQLARESRVQRRRSRLAESSSDRLTTLRNQGFASVAQSQQQQELALEQLGKLRTLDRESAERERELVTLQAEFNELPTRTEVNISNLTRSISQIDQSIAQTEARREQIVTAPQDGVVTSLQVGLGSSANTGVPLLSIVPEGAVLVVHLFGSSRSIGFVQPGQEVNLSYDAYPFQKFGHHAGTIDSVSRSAISPAELPQQLTGLSELFSGTEPIYRIVVTPTMQTVMAYGNSHKLQPGMRLSADILTERRRLYEWVLDPLYTLTGRL